MYGVDARLAFGGLVVLAATSTGCVQSVAFAERHEASPVTSVLRIASERGLRDTSAGGSIVIEIPVEVRTGSNPVTLPGCAIQPFRMPAITGRKFDLNLAVIQADPLIALTTSTSSVPADQARIVTVRLVALLPSAGALQGLGLRFDETPAVLGVSVGCPNVRTTGPDVQHYGLIRAGVDPATLGITGGMLAGGVALLSLLLLGPQ